MLCILTFSDSSIVASTLDHPYYVDGKYIDAEDIPIGSTMHTESGKELYLSARKLVDTTANVYNFTVSGHPNYLVGENRILVHNECVLDLLDDEGFEALKELFDKLEKDVQKAFTRDFKDLSETDLLKFAENEGELLKAWELLYNKVATNAPRLRKKINLLENLAKARKIMGDNITELDDAIAKSQSIEDLINKVGLCADIDCIREVIKKNKSLSGLYNSLIDADCKPCAELVQKAGQLRDNIINDANKWPAELKNALQVCKTIECRRKLLQGYEAHHILPKSLLEKSAKLQELVKKLGSVEELNKLLKFNGIDNGIFVKAFEHGNHMQYTKHLADFIDNKLKKLEGEKLADALNDLIEELEKKIKNECVDGNPNAELNTVFTKEYFDSLNL